MICMLPMENHKNSATATATVKLDPAIDRIKVDRIQVSEMAIEQYAKLWNLTPDQAFKRIAGYLK